MPELHRCLPEPDRKAERLLTFQVTYRILTSRVGKDVPLAIVVSVNLEQGSNITFYGASAGRARSEARLREKLKEIDRECVERNKSKKDRLVLGIHDRQYYISEMMCSLYFPPK